MNRLAFCLFVVFYSGAAQAIGLGDLSRQPILGERLQVEIPVSGAGKEALDSSCYRLKQPSSGEDMPWLRSAVLTLRKGPQPVLEIRSNQIVHDPILALSVHVACGQEVSREYMLLASPQRENERQPVVSANSAGINLPSAVSAPSAVTRQAAEPQAFAKKPVRVKAERPASAPSRKSLVPAPENAAAPAMSRSTAAMSDRLSLSSGADSGEAGLQFATELSSLNQQMRELNENQREMLRLEFRMLNALHEQALTQLAAAEKMRNVDQAVQDLQKLHDQTQAANAPATPVAPSASVPSPAVAPVPPEPDLWEEWGDIALVTLAVLGLLGWLGWRHVQSRREQSALPMDLQPDDDFVDEPSLPADVYASALEPEAETTPPSMQAVDLDLHLDDAGPTAIDVSLADYADDASPGPMVEEATVDEQFEVNPVMELADIMLSFGRVKGAAQALQEYIDANPQEALQPWVRLLEVYRMAGMRKEFEELSLNLNKNFNVEIQHWETPDTAADSSNSIDFVLDEPESTEVQQPKAERIEDMPRILQLVIEQWNGDDFPGFVQQLLRDNRGGARLGFTLSVVAEMLFLVELKETVRRMDAEAQAN